MSLDDPRDVIPQAAAVPFRKSTNGSLDVLLIRRRPDGEWGIPKGLVDPGFTALQAARIEALEEAGIEGDFLGGQLGEFEYQKFGGICRVQVFALQVTVVHARYDEMYFRERQWFAVLDAIERVGRPALRPQAGDDHP